MLPASHPNCTVRFASVPDKGLLLQLNRLNVPCSSGLLQFSTSAGAVTSHASQSSASPNSSSRNICGKLEELPVDSRTLYFRHQQQQQPQSEGAVDSGQVDGVLGMATSEVLLAAVNRAVFSVAFRTVDACYNTTLTEPSRSIRVRSPSGGVGEEPLECYFKIHLPYGYRIKINIVTNFRDSHVTTGSGRTRTIRGATSSDYQRRTKAGGGVASGSVSKSSVGGAVSPDNESVGVGVTYYASSPVNSANYVYNSVDQQQRQQQALPQQQFVDDVNLLPPPEEVAVNSGGDAFLPITSDLHFNYVDNEQWKSGWSPGVGDDDVVRQSHPDVATDSQGNYPSDCGPAGLTVVLWDGDAIKWSQCYDKFSNSRRVSMLSTANVVGIKVLRQGGNALSDTGDRSGFPSLLIEYSAERIDASQCAFGWIGFQQFCLTAVYDKGPLAWHEAEAECQQLGGNLVSIRSREQQRLIDRFLRSR